MKKPVIFALISFIMISCASPKLAQKVSKREVIDFTKEYRDYFTGDELMDQENAAFINKYQLELVGLPAETKTVYFKDNYMIEGNWKHVIIPPGTYGKIINIKNDDIFEVQFDSKEIIKIIFLLDQNGKNYVVGVKSDPNPNIPPGILEKYQFTKKYWYVEHLGGKFYFLDKKEKSELQVDYILLDPEKVVLNGMR